MLYSSSVTKRQQHVYDYVMTKPLTTRVHDRSVKKSTSSNDDIVMDVNPAYGERTVYIKAHDDAEYEVVDYQSQQTKTDDVKMDINPAYAEIKFT